VSVVCPICRRSTTYDPAAGPVGGLAKNFELIHAIRVIHSLSEAAANAMGERKKKRKLLALGDGRRGSRDSSRTDVKRRRSEHMKMKEKKEWRGADEMELSQASSSATKAWRTLVIEEEEEEEEEEGQGKPGIMDNGGSPTTALDSSRGDSSFFTVSTPLVSFQPVFTVSFLNSRSASIPRHGDDRSSACLHAEDTNMRPAPLGDGPQLDSHGDEPDNSQSSSIASGVADGNNEAENVYATLPSAPPAHLFEDEEEQLVHSPRITCSLLSSAFPTDGETNQAQLASGDTHSPSAPLYSAFKGHASWIEHSPACMLCQAAFGLFVRQRRCHHCGGLFCFKCCWQFCEMPSSFGYRRKQRACLRCSRILGPSCPSETIRPSTSTDAGGADPFADKTGSEIPASFNITHKLASIYNISSRALDLGLDLTKNPHQDTSTSTLLLGRCLGLMVALPVFLVGASSVLVAAGGYHAWGFLEKQRKRWQEERRLEAEEAQITKERLSSGQLFVTSRGHGESPQ